MPIRNILTDSIAETQVLLEQYHIQIPYASQRAVNDTAFRVRKRFAERGPEVLDRPKPWIYKAWRVEKARDRNRIRASILIKDPERQGYWHTAIVGGSGIIRNLTQRLHQQGLLPRHYRLIAGNIKTDRYGNVSYSLWKKIESRLNSKEIFAGKLKGRNTYGVFEIKGSGRGRKLNPLFIGVNAKPARANIFSLRKEAGNIGADYYELFREHHANNMRIARQKIKAKGLRKRRSRR